MEVEFSKKDKNEAEFNVKGETHTFAVMLRHYLARDKNVEFASYQMSHPLHGHPVFYVRTKGKTVDKALSDATSLIEAELKEAKAQIKKK